MRRQTRVDVDVLRQLVPVPILLDVHGVELPTRGSRVACPVCDATNPQTFSFNDVRWHCFRCHRGGDVFSLAMALRRCGFREAIAVIGGIAGIGAGQLPRLRPEVAKYQLTLRRRRQALRRWRDRRLNELAVELYELDRDVELVGRLLIRLRHEGDVAPDDGLWALFEDVCSARDEAEWVACQLEQDNEREWARLWLMRRGGAGKAVKRCL